MKFYEDGFDPADLSVKVSELLIATADSSDVLIDGAVTEVLSLLRQRLAMDVVFVSDLSTVNVFFAMLNRMATHSAHRQVQVIHWSKPGASVLSMVACLRTCLMSANSRVKPRCPLLLFR